MLNSNKAKFKLKSKIECLNIDYSNWSKNYNLKLKLKLFKNCTPKINGRCLKGLEGAMTPSPSPFKIFKLIYLYISNF